MKLLFIIPAIILFGCEVVVPVDVPEKTSVVVDGVFTPDSVWSVKISLSQHILKNFQPEIPDNEIKTVTIRDENNVLIESLQYKPAKDSLQREYKGKTTPEFNKTYRLEVETNSYGTVTATSHVPPKVPVTSAKVELISSDRDKGRGYDGYDRLITIEFSDDGNTTNFYELYLIQSHKNYDSIGKQLKNYYYQIVKFSVSDPAYSEKINDNKSLIFDDTLFNGKQAKFSLKIDYDNGDVIIVLRNITEDLYKVTANHWPQRMSDNNPFAEPLLIKGNIQKGYGIFSGFAASAYTF